MDEVEKLYEGLIEKFFVPMPADDLIMVQTRVREMEHRHARTFERYISTVIDIINTLSLPWNMSYDVVMDTSVALVKKVFGMAGVDMKEAQDAALDRMVEQVRDMVLPGHLGLLKDFNNQERFAKSFAAINRQGAVLFYGAAEDFLLTSIEIELEHNPVLLRDVAKKHDSRLGSASVPFDVLIEHGPHCPVSRLVMETIRPKLNSIATIISLCKDVFGREFAETMKSHQRTGLLLFHLRNLIAHRGGVVDRKFLEDTKTLVPEQAFALGEHVSIGHTGLLAFLNYCIWCMVAIGESTGLDARPSFFEKGNTEET